MKRLLGSVAVIASACASTPAPAPAPSGSPPAAGDASPNRTPPEATILGPPTLTDSSRSLPTLRWEDYRALTERIDHVPTLQTKPEGTETAWFGLNLIIDEQNRSYVLLPRGSGQWILYPDEDGDGSVDLSNEGWSLGESFAPRTVGTAGSTYAAAFRVLTQDDGSPRLEAQVSSRRTGELLVDGQAYALELISSRGAYSTAGATLRVDVDRDGVFDPDPLANETFDVANQTAYVSIGATHLGFTIQPDGDRIAWSPRLDVAGPRAPVYIGATAPAFPLPSSPDAAARDAAPEPPFVLEFFSPGCEFCAEAAPEFARATLGPLREAGISVVSIEHGDSGTGRSYAQQTGKSWLVFTDDDGTALSELYRVQSVPTYVAVGADGRICARGNWRALGPQLSEGTPCPSDDPR